MFGYRPSRFGGGDDPWFRIGSLDVGSSGVAGLLVLIGMVLYAIEGSARSISRQLVFVSSDVLSGQVWRLLTWFVPDRPSLWVIISAAIIYLLGSQLEANIGRIRMAQFLVVLVLIPSVAATLLDLIGFAPIVLNGGDLLGSAIFYAFVAHMPTAKFFFGIPGWVLAAVFVALEILSLLADRNSALLLLLFIRVAGTVVAARSFGLAQDLPMIPRIAIPGGGGGGGGSSGGRGRGKSKRTSAPLSVVQDNRFEDLDIDAILDQVSAFGVDSLTSEQKKRLKAYSKNRKKKE